MTTTQQLANLYPADPYQPAGESLYVPGAPPESESLYPTADFGDRFTSVFVPPARPAPRGVFDAVTWIQNGTLPLRFLDGITVRQSNIGLDAQLGVWGEDWCGDPNDTKAKNRPDPVHLETAPITVYAWDSNQCGDLTQGSRDEVRARAQQIMTLGEQTAVEKSLAQRFLAEVPTPTTATTITEAVSVLEAALARAGVTGCIHASPKWAAYLAAEARLSNGGTSPMGHRWVFGNGYTDTLGDTLVATTDLYGWRGPLAVRDTIQHDHNQYVVLVERSLLIAYEAAVAAVTVTP